MSTISFPPEILLEIFQWLSVPELASARLTCKKILPIINGFLFCELVLYGHVKSFQRMRELATSPFRVFVKRLVYSGLFLGGVSGKILRRTPRDVAAARRVWDSNKIKSAQQEQARDDHHWNQFRRHIESQATMQSGDSGLENLERGLKLFPNLREVEFRSGVEACCKCHSIANAFTATKSCRCSPESNRIARDTLMYPDYESGRTYHGKQFRALLSAAYANPKINVFKASEPPANMKKEGWTQGMRKSIGKCRHLTVGMTLDSPEVAELLRNATRLESLYAYGHIKRFRTWTRDLDHIATDGGHWPFLNSLTLQKITANFSSLKTLVSSHAATLRVLRLMDITLTGTNPGNTASTRRSWISLIETMRTTLCLTNVRLDGSFKGVVEPGFVTHDPYEKCSVCTKSPRAPKGTLRYRIEDYILHGGSFSHQGFEGEEAWSALAERTTMDCTWKVLWG